LEAADAAMCKAIPEDVDLAKLRIVNVETSTEFDPFHVVHCVLCAFCGE
jgi:hypothetical protein